MTDYIEEKDFDVQVRVRNGRLLRAIRKHYKSTAEFCRKYNLGANSVNALITMRVRPINKHGWTQLAYDVALLLGKDPEDLWPDDMKEIKLRRSTASFGADFDEVLQITQQRSLEKFIEQKQTLDLITKQLTYREKYCVKAYFEDGKTYQEIATVIERSTERARSIIARALMKAEKTAQANNLMTRASSENKPLYDKERGRYVYRRIYTPRSISSTARELFKDD